MAQKRRVATLYRVSTKGQLEGNEIPMQQRACHDFIEQNGWTLVKEYVEKGVSGYKTATEDRDELQRAKYDAENGHYDVLLVFMFDRLGRRTYETPMLLKWFNDQGIEVWSVKEGRQDFKDESSDITNFLRFWQSNNESKKTSMRVNEKHEQMVKDGAYRGGTAPYGYKLIKSGEVNKKGKELMKLSVNEDQAIIVRQMFSLVKDEGYGSNRISQYLNERGIKTSTGSNWNTGAINFILRNPIYKGYPSYGKRKSKEGVFESKDRDKWILPEHCVEELVIIAKDDFDYVQTFRSSRSVENIKKHEYSRVNSTKSPLLLVGMIKCGYCGSPLTTTYNSKKYVLANGDIQKWKRAVYRCSGKALKKVECVGQTMYSQSKIEDTVLDEVENYLAYMKKIDYSKFADDYDQDEHQFIKKSLDNKNKELETAFEELNALKSEISKSIMGKSTFKPELLNELIEQKQEDIKNIDAEVRKLETDLNAKKIELSDIKELADSIGIWNDKFKEASHEKQKTMLRSIIENVTVFKDSIDIKFRLDIVQFLSNAGNGSVSELRGRAHRWQR